MLDDGYSGEQSWSLVKRQDRTCRRRQALSFRSDDTIEIWNDCTEYPESPRLLTSRKGSWDPSHQENPGDVGWRCPSSNAALVFTVEESFSYKRSLTVAAEGRGLKAKLLLNSIQPTLAFACQRSTGQFCRTRLHSIS
jgi:hypothetical protein